MNKENITYFGGANYFINKTEILVVTYSRATFFLLSTRKAKERFIMKSTGIVRKLDELGRITLPIELRRTLGVSERDPLEIFVEEDRIILQKYEPTDIFTGEKNELFDFCGKKVSKESISQLAKLAGIIE